MNPRRTLITIIGTAALAAGTAGAVAATSDQSKAETAVLSDAAKRLDITPEKLRAALAAAEDAQLDAAVKAGTLTQAQADEMKARRTASGSVLGHAGGGHRGGPGGGPRGGGVGKAAAAKALGLTHEELDEQLQTKSLADVAKAQGRSLASVKAAVKADLTKRLDAEVKAERITGAQRDAALSAFDEHFDAEADAVRPRGGGGPKGGHDGPHPGGATGPGGPAVNPAPSAEDTNPA